MDHALADRHADVARYLRRNYLVHSVEGGLFVAGIAAVSPNTVLPRMVEALGGPNWLIALTPILLMVGFIGPGIFVAHRIEHLDRMRPFLLWLGILQRLPFLATGLFLILFADALPWLVLPAVALTPLISGLCGGVGAIAWKEYIAKSIPERRRASLWAIRFVIASALGLGVAKVVEVVLARYESRTAYGLLHLSAFGLMLGSYVIFALSREPNYSIQRLATAQTWRHFMKDLPPLLRADRQLRLYAINRILAHGVFIVMPFLGIQALRVLDYPDSFLGYLLLAQTAGMVAGNLLGGYWGDSFGSRLPLVLSQIGFVLVCALAPFARAEWMFVGLFALLGSCLALEQVGGRTLDLEICAEGQRVRAQALIGLFTLFGVLLAALLSALIRSVSETMIYLAVPALLSTLLSLVLLHRIKEPRIVVS
jgi:MFS family permease